MIETVGEAVALGMYVVIHAGFDPVSPDLVHAPPARSRHLIDAVGETGSAHIILAHMGGVSNLTKYANICWNQCFVRHRLCW